MQRALKHVRYLRDYGWNPIVLTVENGQFPARDESLLEQIPADTIIKRTHIYEPYDIYRALTGKKPGSAVDVETIKKEGQKVKFTEKLAEFIRATFFIPDARIGWQITARKAAMQLIKEHNIQAIYSSSPPYTCSMIAHYVKRKTGLPWVAGFRDPWTDFISSPKRWFLPKAIDKSFEHSVFAESDFVECAWEGIIKDALGKYPDLDANKFIHVPNGFDSNDFPKAEYKPNEKFTVTYTGSMYGRRNPSALFEALNMLIARGEISPDDFTLRFVGRFGSEVHEMFDKSGFRQSIETVNYIPHHESIAKLMASDALLLIVDESKESEEIVPGKVYEYIGTKRPVIAIAPTESAIAKLMRETRAGEIAHQSEPEKIARIFMNYYNDWKTGSSNFSPDHAAINAYERKEASKKLAELLKKIN